MGTGTSILSLSCEAPFPRSCNKLNKYQLSPPPRFVMCSFGHGHFFLLLFPNSSSVPSEYEIKTVVLQRGSSSLSNPLDMKGPKFSSTNYPEGKTNVWQPVGPPPFTCLLTRREKAFLPILATLHNEDCPICLPQKETTQRIDRHQAETFLNKNPPLLLNQLEGDLKISGGVFWVALARAIRSRQPPQERNHPFRERRQVHFTGFTDFSHAISGSLFQECRQNQSMGPSSAKWI